MDPTLLELEVTETVAIEDIDAASQALQAVRAIGVRVAVDDFGTGYSSLGRLRQIPVDALKIDRSFIEGRRPGLRLPRGSCDRARHRRPRARDGLSVVAEGVETASQLAVLCELGCDLAQGYVYSPAVEADAVARLVAKGRAGRTAPSRADA